MTDDVLMKRIGYVEESTVLCKEETQYRKEDLMWEGWLPVGSVVLLKGAKQKIMIVGICQIIREEADTL